MHDDPIHVTVVQVEVFCKLDFGMITCWAGGLQSASPVRCHCYGSSEQFH